MGNATDLKRILILDDDADFRGLLKVYLGKMFPGVQVDEYDPVARGVPGDDFDWSPYDALILDYYLCINNLTGLDVLQAHRGNRDFPATVMMTGAGNEEIAVRALRAGVYDYLRKEKFSKQQLKASLLAAVENHRVERARLLERTNHNRAFNKSLFYQELEQGGERGISADRVLLLVDLDQHQNLEEQHGVIIRDNIVRHVAKRCYEYFKATKSDPHVTRQSDQSVSLLINAPGSFEALDSLVAELCAELQQDPYRFDEKQIDFTVSIGVVPVPKFGRSAEALLRIARDSVLLAGIHEHNSYHIHIPRVTSQDEEICIPEPITESIPEPEPIPEPAAAVPEAVPETISAPPPAVPEPAPEPVRAREPAPVPVAVPVVAPAPRAAPAKPPAPAPAPASASAPAPAPAARKVAHPPPAAPKPAPAPAPAAPASPAPPKTRKAEPAPAVKPAARPAPAKRTGETAASPPPPRPAVPPPTARIPTAAATTGGAAPAGIRPTAPVTPAAPVAPPPSTAATTRPPPAAVKPAATRSVSATVAPVAPAKSAPPPAAPRNDLELDEAALSPEALAIKKAFDEDRVTQLFYPVISLTEAEQETGREIYRIGLQIVDTSGAITGEELIYSTATVPALRQFIDRWQLRETIGRVVRQQRQRYLFLLRLSEASLADPGLFNWLRKLLAGFDKQQPGKSIGLEVAAADFLELEKPAGALISYLHKSHGFRFALGQVREPPDVAVASKDGRFDLVLMHSAQLKSMTGKAPPGDLQVLEQLRTAGRRILVDDIQDSMSLTEAIGLGADLAMGRFVGEPLQELGEVGGVQTVELV